MPLKAAHNLDVSRQHRVGRDNEIGAVDLLAPFVAVEPMPYDEPQIRSELRRLRHPIGDKARWYDDERRAVEPPRGALPPLCGQASARFSPIPYRRRGCRPCRLRADPAANRDPVADKAAAPW